MLLNDTIYCGWYGLTVAIDMADETLKKNSSERGGAPKPPPEPFYTLRPHASDVTAVRYINVGSKGGILSGCVRSWIFRFVYTHL